MRQELRQVNIEMRRKVEALSGWNTDCKGLRRTQDSRSESRGEQPLSGKVVAKRATSLQQSVLLGTMKNEHASNFQTSKDKWKA